jgi:HEAT repeat protein
MNELAIAAGVTLMLTAWLMRRLRARRVSRALLAALGCPDPSVRVTAVHVMAQEGLRRYAGPLLDVAAHDADASVREALADAVRRRRWEPAHDKDVVRLRRWAETPLWARR